MIRPLGDRVVIQRTTETSEKIGDIYLPDSAREVPMEGEVVAIGKDVTDMKVSNKVLFSKYGGTDVTIDGEDFKILDHKDILAVI